MRFAVWLSLTLVLSGQTRPVPVDNEWARVVIAQNTPGQKSRLHRHDRNRVMVHLSPGAMRLAYDNGKGDDIRFQAGDVRWDPRNGLHTSENIGGTTYQIVEVELRKEGGAVNWPAKDPVRVAPGNYEPVFENQQVRVLRVRFAPRGRIVEHTHSQHRITVALTDAHIVLTQPDGARSETVLRPGDVRIGSPGTHSEESQLDKAAELILIDLK